MYDIKLIPIFMPTSDSDPDMDPTQVLPGFHLCHPPTVKFTGPASNIITESSKFDVVVEHYVSPLKENTIGFVATLGTKYNGLARKPMPSASGTMVSVSATVMGPRAKSTSSPPGLIVDVDYISFLSAAIPNAPRTPKVEKTSKSIYLNFPLCGIDSDV